MPFLVVTLLALGCPDTAGDDDTSGGDDDLTGDDDDATADDDDQADDDDLADDDDQADDDSAGDDDDSAGPLDVSGGATMYYYNSPGHDWSFTETLSLGASFTAVYEYGKGGSGPTFVSPKEIDTCAVNVYSPDDFVPGTEGVSVSLSAGTMALGTPGGPVVLEPSDDGSGNISYGVELDASDPAALDTTYDLASPGDEFPAFALTATMPPLLLLTSPDVTDYFELGGDLDVVWDGAVAGEDLWLQLYDEAMDDEVNVQIDCWVDNDGSFTVPADAVDQLPAGDVRLSIGKGLNADTLAEGDEYTVTFSTGVLSMAVGYVL